MSWLSAAKMVWPQSLGATVRSRRRPRKISWTQRGDERGVFAIVIERVAAGDAFNDKPRSLIEGVAHARFLVAVYPTVSLG
jgi:hypothetical protein